MFKKHFLAFWIIMIIVSHNPCTIFAGSWTWSGPVDGNWGTAAYWTTSDFPTPPPKVPDWSDRVTINNLGQVIINSNQSYGNISISGGAELKITAGDVVVNNAAANFIVGQGGANGKLTMTGGTLTSDKFIVAEGGSGSLSSNVGAASFSGNAVHTMNQLLMSYNSVISNSRMEIKDDATVRVTEAAIIGQRYSDAEAVQTGGSFIIKPLTASDSVTLPTGSASQYGLIIGRNLGQGTALAGSASYTISGGQLHSYYDVKVGDFDAPGGIGNYLYKTYSALNVAGGEVKIMADPGGITYPGGTVSGGNLLMGYSGDAPFSGSLSDNMYGTSEVNISGGSFYVEGKVIGYGANNYFTIHGTGASKVEVGGIEPAFGGNANGTFDNVDVQLRLDKNGVTPLTVNGLLNTNMLTWFTSLSGSKFRQNNGVKIITQGFVALQVQVFDLVIAESYSESYTINAISDYSGFRQAFSSANLTIGVDTATGWQKLSFRAPDTVVWDLDNGDDFFNPVNLTKGYVKVVGTESFNIEVVLKQMGAATIESLLPAFLEFLNDPRIDSGVKFTQYSATSLLMEGSYLNTSGEAWFGWDLTSFHADECGACGIGFEKLNLLEPIPFEFEFGVPEPATWTVLLLGGSALLVFRRRKK